MYSLRSLLVGIFFVFFSFFSASGICAQEIASEEQMVTTVAAEVVEIHETVPQTGRDLRHLRPWNLMAIAVSHMLSQGIPPETIVLLLLLPALATIPAFNRHILGFPTMGIFVPAALSVILLDTTSVPGLVLLVTVWIISLAARSVLKWVRIMHMPKMALLVLIVGWGILGCLSLGTWLAFPWVRQISPFAILLAVLLSERFISLLANRSLFDFSYYTSVTLLLSLIGYWLLTNPGIHQFILTYPEIVLLLIPINVLIGRYFGLRLTELFRFKKLIFYRYASK